MARTLPGAPGRQAAGPAGRPYWTECHSKHGLGRPRQRPYGVILGAEASAPCRAWWQAANRRRRSMSDEEFLDKLPPQDLIFKLPPTFDDVEQERRHRKERLPRAPPPLRPHSLCA